MGPRWRSALLASAIAATIAAAALTASPAARAQTSPSSGDGDTGATACPASNAPNELTLVGGTPQTAQLESGFAGALQVELANTNGCPLTTTVTGTTVTFSAPANGASATFAASGSNTLTTGTDATGSASAQMLTANDTPGTYTVTASSAYGSVSFALTNSAAGIPAAITPVGAASLRATTGTRYAEPLAVRVVDANGTPVVGATVTFSLGGAAAGAGAGAAAAGASFDGGTSQATETTDADGVATSPGLRANATSGAFTATATVAHVVEPARFALDNVAAKPHTVAPLGPASATATVAAHYALPLRVVVRNGAGRPVAGATVTFTLGASAAASASAGAGGAGATFTGGATQATATSGPRGIATSPRLSANDDAGTFVATARATGASGLALFHLRNRAGAPATVTAGVGATQSTAIGTRFAIPLADTVSDSHGNRVAGVRVTFTAPSSGPSGHFADGRTRARATTNSSGIAVAPPFIANGATGGYVVTAAAGDVRPTAFALVNTG